MSFLTPVFLQPEESASVFVLDFGALTRGYVDKSVLSENEIVGGLGVHGAAVLFGPLGNVFQRLGVEGTPLLTSLFDHDMVSGSECAHQADHGPAVILRVKLEAVQLDEINLVGIELFFSTFDSFLDG